MIGRTGTTSPATGSWMRAGLVASGRIGAFFDGGQETDLDWIWQYERAVSPGSLCSLQRKPSTWQGSGLYCWAAGRQPEIWIYPANFYALEAAPHAWLFPRTGSGGSPWRCGDNCGRSARLACLRLQFPFLATNPTGDSGYGLSAGPKPIMRLRLELPDGWQTQSGKRSTIEQCRPTPPGWVNRFAGRNGSSAAVAYHKQLIFVINRVGGGG